MSAPASHAHLERVSEPGTVGVWACKCGARGTLAEWKAPEITPAPVVEAPAPANPEITPAAAARFAETAGAIDPPRRTARGGQLEVALPELPAPQHVEVYVGPPRAAQVERLDACILAALVALREGIKSSDWACVRVAAAILNETGGAR